MLSVFLVLGGELHAPDELLSEQTQRELRERTEYRLGKQTYTQVLQRVPQTSRLRHTVVVAQHY